ncbi:TolC family protein [Kordiimonas marina]|uniref:TolC family protein n=1 Tax=Kordiimonas marina TaxID=2872312 RepID=UPI001FF1DC22|nr:TolC family protein [Kordiimonas marina]MCJ9429440.1 TolC family protein [Kordiimonas marina]
MKRRILPLLLTSTFLITGCAIKPVPFTDAENAARAQTDLQALFKDQEPISAPLTLDDAIARALKYNLDQRLKLMEEAVAMGQLDVARMDLLPDLVARAGISSRSNKDSTYNTAKTATSTSSDRTRKTADLSVSWNVLDFAIGYMRARQQADTALIVQERRRNVIHNVVNDVRRAYWRAAAAERALKQFAPVIKRVRGALDEAQKRVSENVGNSLDALKYQQDLLLTLRELETRHRQLLEAKTELATLINVRPGTDFHLAAADGPIPTAEPDMPMTVDKMETEALKNRSELREEAYQLRVYRRDAKIAVMDMLPGLNFTTGINYTSDSYKLNQDWYDGAMNLSWNLMKIVQAPANLHLANSNIDLSKVRRLALSMAVLSQVHIAELRFNHAKSDFDLANKIANVQDQIFDRLSAGRKANTISEAQEIRGEVRALLSGLQRDMAYADMQAAYGRIFATVGANPLPASVPDNSVASLSKAVGTVLAKWDKGQYDEPERLPEGTAVSR